MGSKFITYFGYVFGVACLILLRISEVNENKAIITADKSVKLATVTAPKLNDKIDAVAETISDNFRVLHDTIRVEQSINLIKQLDTAQRALELKAGKEFQNRLIFLEKENFELKNAVVLATQALTAEKMLRRNVYIASASKPDKNASIGFDQIKKKLGKFLSPERDYLRVTNLLDSGTINSLPYYDYQLASEKRYQFLVQARSSYTPDINRWSLGLGVELKADRFSLNFVNNYVPQSLGNKWLNPAFGFRYDIIRIPIL